MDAIMNIIGAAFVEKCLGALDYYCRPSYRASWCGPFNGQKARRKLFLDLLENINFESIVETGTYRGTTTAYLHESSRLPVYTVEMKPRYFGYARARFAFRRDIYACCADSRTFLQQLAETRPLLTQ